MRHHRPSLFTIPVRSTVMDSIPIFAIRWVDGNPVIVLSPAVICCGDRDEQNMRQSLDLTDAPLTQRSASSMAVALKGYTLTQSVRHASILADARLTQARISLEEWQPQRRDAFHCAVQKIVEIKKGH